MCVCVCVWGGGGGGGGGRKRKRANGYRQEVNRHYSGYYIELQYTSFKGGKRTCRNEEACEITTFMWHHNQNEVLLKFQ